MAVSQCQSHSPFSVLPTFPTGHLLVITKGHCRIVCQGCHGTWKTWKKGNFLIKSGKILKSQGKKLKKHRSQGKVRECFCIICVFQWYA